MLLWAESRFELNNQYLNVCKYLSLLVVLVTRMHIPIVGDREYTNNNDRVYQNTVGTVKINHEIITVKKQNHEYRKKTGVLSLNSQKLIRQNNQFTFLFAPNVSHQEIDGVAAEIGDTTCRNDRHRRIGRQVCNRAPSFRPNSFRPKFFVQSYQVTSVQVRLGLDEMDWTKTGWTKMNWTKISLPNEPIHTYETS